MSKAIELSRRSLRRDQILELHLSQLPEPSPQLLKMPGFADWFQQLKLMRERDMQALERLVANIGGAGPVADAVSTT